MKRLLWISVGVGITIYTLRKISQANETLAHFTPAGIASAAAGAGDNLRLLGASFRESMAEHEAYLTQALFEPKLETDPGPESRFDDDDPEEYF